MIVGIERELNGKPAGVRTCALVSLGSAIFSMVSSNFSFGANFVQAADPTRIAAQIVSGIGFLGAGVILIDRGRNVIGLTTAAAVWTVAAIGMAIGFGNLVLGTEATILAVIVMFGIGVVERKFVSRIEKLSKKRSTQNEQ